MQLFCCESQSSVLKKTECHGLSQIYWLSSTIKNTKSIYSQSLPHVLVKAAYDASLIRARHCDSLVANATKN